MALYAEYLAGERKQIMDNDIRTIQIGRREGLPNSVVRELDITEEMSRGNTGMTLCLALNYGSRAEIVDTVRRLARQVEQGQLRPDDIDEDTISGACPWTYNEAILDDNVAVIFFNFDTILR